MYQSVEAVGVGFRIRWFYRVKDGGVEQDRWYAVVPAPGLGRTSLDLTEPPSDQLLRVEWSALAPDLPNVDYSSLNHTRDVLLHGREVAYEVNSRWPRLLLHIQYELNGSPLLSVSAYRAVLRAQGVLTT